MIYGLLSCSDDPTRVGRPPVVEEFAPIDQFLEAFTGDTLVFSVRAMDPDRAILRQRFTVNDSIVSGAPRFTYVVDDTGLVTVRCIVTDGEYNSRIQWMLQRYLRVNHPPEIYSFSPVEPNPTMIIGTDLEFVINARDEDGDPIQWFFAVDGEKVTTEDRFLFTPEVEGERIVEAVVSDGELKATHRWDLTVLGVPDTTPPAQVPIVNVETGAEPGEIDVAWIAVGQDGFEGQASNYLVRTSPAAILTEEDWERASVQPGVPQSRPSGETMSMTIRGMIPGRFTHVAVRALDDFGNISPLGDSPGVYTRGMRITGNLIDAVTLAPIPAANVRLAHFSTSSDVNGEFQFIELPPLVSTVLVRDELTPGFVGMYYDYEVDYTVVHLDHLSLYILPGLPMPSTYYETFYQFFRAITDTPGIPQGAQQRRWELPIDVYVPPYTRNGLDFRATVIDVLAEFDQILGYPMYNVVDEIPAVGVDVVFPDGLTADNYQTIDWTPDNYPLRGQVRFRTHYAPASIAAFKIIIRHEFGHALGLFHSADRNHLMVGGQTPAISWFSSEELSVIRARYHTPRGVDMRDHMVE